MSFLRLDVLLMLGVSLGISYNLQFARAMLQVVQYLGTIFALEYLRQNPPKRRAKTTLQPLLTLEEALMNPIDFKRSTRFTPQQFEDLYNEIKDLVSLPMDKSFKTSTKVLRTKKSRKPRISARTKVFMFLYMLR